MFYAFVPYTFPPGNREKFMKEMLDAGIPDYFASLDICTRYEWLVPNEDDDNTLMLMEGFTSLEDVKPYMEKPMYKNMTALKAKYGAQSQPFRANLLRDFMADDT